MSIFDTGYELADMQSIRFNKPHRLGLTLNLLLGTIHPGIQFPRWRLQPQLLLESTTDAFTVVIFTFAIGDDFVHFGATWAHSPGDKTALAIVYDHIGKTVDLTSNHYTHLNSYPTNITGTKK